MGHYDELYEQQDKKQCAQKSLQRNTTQGVKLTQEQFDALIKYIDASIANASRHADCNDSVRKLRAQKVLEKVLLSNDSNEDQD